MLGWIRGPLISSVLSDDHRRISVCNVFLKMKQDLRWLRRLRAEAKVFLFFDAGPERGGSAVLRSDTSRRRRTCGSRIEAIL